MEHLIRNGLNSTKERKTAPKQRTRLATHKPKGTMNLMPVGIEHILETKNKPLGNR